MPPLEFVPIAEETGLIVDIGTWVLAVACEQQVSWRRQGCRPVSVSVNLSPAQFRHDQLVANVARIIERTGITADCLELELTEGVLIEDVAASAGILADLQSLGVRVSVDDFGTGYSSLGYLKRFPINALKIDRSFVRDLVTDSDDAAIVGAMIALAHSLRLTAVAEGVETEDQFSFLRGNGCDEVQGFLFGRPVPADDIRRLLMDEPAAAVAGAPV